MAATSGITGITLLTTMQWFYGPTWGSTLKLCGAGPPTNCVAWPDLHARTLELIETLRRNAHHPAVAEVHLLVAEAEPVERLLSRLDWYQRRGKKVVRLSAIAERPSFLTYMRYASEHLVGRTVVFVNQDIYLAGGWSKLLAAGLPQGMTYFLSRYHRRTAYSVAHSAEALRAEGLLNMSDLRGSAPPAAAHGAAGVHHARSGRAPLLFRAGGEGGQGEGHQHGWARRVCDMTTREYSLWSRSLCNPTNFGSCAAPPAS